MLYCHWTILDSVTISVASIPKELELKDTTDPIRSTWYLDLLFEITKLYDKHDNVLFRIINFSLVCGNSPSAPEGITSKVLRSSYWICWHIWCVYLYRCTWSLLPFFEGVRVAHLLLVVCVFSFISYVLLVVHILVFVSVFIASSLSLDSWVLDFALTVVTLDFTFT